jgi:OST3/OST6 family protein
MQWRTRMARGKESVGVSYRRRRLGEQLDQAWSFLTSEQTVLIAIYAFSLFLLAGGIFDIVENTQPVIGSGTNILFLYPGIQGQTTYESIGAAILFAITLGGTYLMYQSTRKVHEPRYSSQLLLFGSLIFVFGFLAFAAILNAKGVGI